MSEFVPFKIAKKLKEKGFTLPVLEIYGKFDNDGMFHSQLYCNYCETMDAEEIIAPTISQVSKWLRKEKKIHIGVLYHGYYAVWIQPMKRNEAEHVIHDCKTHEGAELEGIEFVLDNLI